MTKFSFLSCTSAGLLTVFLSISAAAQRHATPIPPASTMPTVRVSDSTAQPVSIRSVEIDTDIVGRDARTRVELRLFNPNPRILEGELQFPLSEGQVVSGFALDIGGQLRDASAIPKARGQEIFEDIRRRNVDPALLEVTAGNQYKLRVYPIPARGERRVVLIISEQLTAANDRAGRWVAANGRAQWKFPLAYSNELDRVRMSVNIAGARSAQVNVQRGPSEMVMRNTADGVTLEFEREHWRAPIPANAMVHLDFATRSGEHTLFGQTKGQHYFVTTIAFDDETVRRENPRHVSIVWDASGSAKDQQKLLPALEAFFQGLRTPPKISLIVVRNKVDLQQTIPASSDAWNIAKKAIRELHYDGSSNFDRLPIPDDTDLTIFVSDGLTTDGERTMGYKSRAPLIALSATVSADAPRLKRLAESTGGQFIDASSTKSAEVANAMSRAGWRIESIEGSGAEKLAVPSALVQNGELRVAGILQSENATLTVRLRHPNKGERTITRSVRRESVSQSKPRLVSQGWPGQLWAAWQIAALATEPHVNASAMQRIASEHGIVGPTSSLIVLETPEDYARYEVSPPEDLRDAVARLTQQKRSTDQTTQSAHIERMVREFNERQRWWEREFPKNERPKIAIEKKKEAASTAGAAVGNVIVEQRRERVLERADADSSRTQTMASPPPPAPAAPVAAAAPASLESRMALRDEPRNNAIAREASGAGARVTTNAAIALQAWTPDAVYLRRLREGGDADLYRIYLDLRDDHMSSSSFYLDVASFFFERKQDELALRILSNLAEMNLENRQLLRLYGYRLNQAKRFDLAIPVFDRVRALAPNEPQSWRDLGLAYSDRGDTQKAVDMLWETVSRKWHDRFAGVNMIALAEMNALIARSKSIDTKRIDPRLIRNMPLGLRVTMAWDTDDTDIDLWVIDPNGERSAYDHRLSYQGAAMSPDATGGYGPEEFALRDPKAGKYEIHAQFYGHRQQVVSNGTTVMVRVTTGFGTTQSRDEWMTLRLTKGRETVRIGTIDVR